MQLDLIASERLDLDLVATTIAAVKRSVACSGWWASPTRARPV
jgi:hypothetical protein